MMLIDDDGGADLQGSIDGSYYGDGDYGDDDRPCFLGFILLHTIRMLCRALGEEYISGGLSVFSY